MTALYIPSISITSHEESHPLGKSEWLKFFGRFFNRQARADSIFQEIETAYLKTKRQYQRKDVRAKVLAGYYRRGNWVAPGGKSYFAQLLEDAGADYVFKDDEHSGNITLSFEHVYEIGLEAEYLFFISMGAVKWELIRGMEPLIDDWLSVTEKKVFSNDASLNAQGSNNYWGKGFLEPHIILADLAKAITKERAADSTLVYFRNPI